MTRTIMIDELYLVVRAPRGLPEQEYRAIRRVLDSDRFAVELRRAVRGVVKLYPALGPVRITVTR